MTALITYMNYNRRSRVYLTAECLFLEIKTPSESTLLRRSLYRVASLMESTFLARLVLGLGAVLALYVSK